MQDPCWPAFGDMISFSSPIWDTLGRNEKHWLQMAGPLMLVLRG